MGKIFNKKLVVLLITGICLTACGQKGALYLPEKTHKNPQLLSQSEPSFQQLDPQDTTNDF